MQVSGQRPGGADGAHNRFLSRTVTTIYVGVCFEGIFDPLAGEVFMALNAVQVDLVKDTGAVAGAGGNLGGCPAGVQPQGQGGVP